MAGAQAQHSLGNRETPRIAAGIFPIGGASGQRMRRYFFGASPPGGGGGNNTKKPGATGRGRNSRKEPGTMRVPQCQKCQTTPPATRTGSRRQPAGQTTGGGQRAAHSRKQAAGDGQRATGSGRPPAESGRRAGSNPSGRRQHRASRRFHVHTNSPQRPHDAHTGTAAVLGTGNRRSLRNRADSAPAKIMQANRYYPQRYRKSSE